MTPDPSLTPFISNAKTTDGVLVGGLAGMADKATSSQVWTDKMVDEGIKLAKKWLALNPGQKKVIVMTKCSGPWNLKENQAEPEEETWEVDKSGKVTKIKGQADKVPK
jgi:hypothetical protein